MEKIESKDFAFHKALAKDIIAEIEEFLPKLNKNILRLSEEYFDIEKQMKNIGNIDRVFEYAQKYEDLKKEIITNLAVNNRLLNIIEKNKERINYIEKEIKMQKITEVEIPQKQLFKMISEKKIDVSDAKINLNSNCNNNYKIFFDERLLLIKDSYIALDNKETVQELSSLEEKALFTIFDKYPDCIGVLPDSILLKTKLKLKILKYIANVTNQMMKTKSLYEINKYFGNLLNIQIGSDIDFKTYITEINNLFNIKIRYFLLDNYKDSSELIKEKIECNLTSVFLPQKYKGENNEIEALSNLFDSLVNNI